MPYLITFCYKRRENSEIIMKCAVWNCVNDDGPAKVSIFPFPKRKEYIDRWLKFCQCSSSLYNKKTWGVCIEHFKEDDMMELNKKKILRLGAVPCINKNEKSTTANKNENQKTNQQKNKSCNIPAVNAFNTTDTAINVRYEDGTAPVDQNIAEASDASLHTDVDIKCEYQDLDVEEENTFPPQSNECTVSSEECGASDEAYVINELDDEDSCSSTIFASNENTRNCNHNKRKRPSRKKHMLKQTTNRRQFRTMVSILSERPDIVREFRKCSRQHMQSFWDDTTKLLNSLGPPFKDSATWKKVWLDYKSYIKKKVYPRKAAGKGDRRLHTFSDLEKVVIRICEFGTSKSVTQEIPMDHCTESKGIVTSPPEIPISADKPDTLLRTSPLDDMPSDSKKSIVHSKDDNTLPEDDKTFTKVECENANESFSNSVKDFYSAGTTKNIQEVLLPSQQEPHLVNGFYSAGTTENFQEVLLPSQQQPHPVNDFYSAGTTENFEEVLLPSQQQPHPVNDFSSSVATDNFQEVLLPSQRQPQRKPDTTTRSLLQTQLSIQQHFYKKSTELSKRNNQKLDEIARNLSTISKAHESFAKTQADMLQEMCRHNRAMEELKREQLERVARLDHHNS